ncbi:hypothetical protein CRG98_007486 [Punica granatum]|uniref:Uncharacterized protein n=1 Tax=Punica granatum TaxID=22663 RepID=A0A2I0KUE4_PUNGR|nr:hypothetical protein CRG98_007486 [Punica granatum]
MVAKLVLSKGKKMPWVPLGSAVSSGRSSSLDRSCVRVGKRLSFPIILAFARAVLGCYELRELGGGLRAFLLEWRCTDPNVDSRRGPHRATWGCPPSRGDA